MARRLRVEFPGAIYHVTLRGNARGRIFLDPRNYERFLWRLSESADTYNVRIYLFCLMVNHAHLVVETPEGNLSRFMQSLETGYTVYFNMRHARAGHLTQGRYGAKLVEGDPAAPRLRRGSDYFLSLSRYVHLNPAFVRSVKELPLKDRIQHVRRYPWSSYGSYIGRSKALDFVDYGPVLAQMAGGKNEKRKRYREFVESGLAETDEEFREAMKASRHCIGGEDFRNRVGRLYESLVAKSDHPEDVTFRRQTERIPVDRILEILELELGTSREAICRRHRDSTVRPIASRMLCKYGGLTQREVGRILGLRTGTGISLQLRKLTGLMATDTRLKRIVERVEKRLDVERQRSSSPAR